MKRLLALLLVLTCGLFLFSCGQSDPDKLIIGYIVKQPDEPWFRTEWMFAQKFADEKGIELMKVPAPTGQAALDAIETLHTSGAKGFVICTPDPKIGPSIQERARKYGMKFMTVDDQFVDGDGKIMTDVPHMGMSPWDIGQDAAREDLKELHKREWRVPETGVIMSTFEQLDTAKQRTDGAKDVLLKDGAFKPEQFFGAPNLATLVSASKDAVYDCLTQNRQKHPEIKHWIIVGMNDAAVLGGVRATEAAGIKPEDVIGCGINGTDCHAELAKDTPTGFIGSMLPNPNIHGYETTKAVYTWVTKGEAPPSVTLIKRADFLNHQNFKEVLAAHGMEVNMAGGAK